MSTTEDLESLCERLAQSVTAQCGEFEGHRVRADAGESGMMYVALKGARGDALLAERLAARLGAIVEAELGEEDVEFAISSGSSLKDLLLLFEFRRRS